VRHRGAGQAKQQPSNEERARRAAERATRSKPEPINWLSVVLLGGLLVGGGGTLAVKAYNGFSRFFEPTYEVIDPQNTGYLQEIMFKGEPWVVFCGRKTANGRVNNTYEGRSSLTSVKTMDTLAVKANYRFRVGLMDCSAVLPSGKTIYERFKLKPKASSSQIAFWVANGSPPRIIDPAWLRASNEYEVARLATKIASWTSLKMDHLTSTKQLTKKCVEYKRGCLVVVHKAQALPANKKQVMDDIMKNHRKLRYFILDITKRQISLHLPPAMMGYPQLLFVKKIARGEGVDRFFEYKYSVFDDEFEKKEVEKFLEHGTTKGPEDSTFWQDLEPIPRISKTIAPPSTPRDTTRKRTAKPKGPTRRRKDENTKKAQAAAKKRRQREQSKAAPPEEADETDEEKYKRRRRKMDEDILENAPQALEEDDFEGGDAGMGEGMEEEEEAEIDLDLDSSSEDEVEILPEE